ncbi:MAG: hypothetical protein HY721_35545 [Planctomycetes bacterium]|nr:hypothetical protein [Planctomycetota bacterium]
MSSIEDRATPCSSAPGCCSSVTRRGFLKTAGAVALTSFVVEAPPAAGQAPSVKTAAGVRHFVPAEKNLGPEWLKGLRERGSTRVYRGRELDSIGMPVGGIGAGQLYLRGDGTLGVWQIFNRHHFSGYGADNYRPRAVDSPVKQGFEVTVRDEATGNRFTASLDRDGFHDIELTGEYPIARVRYAEKGFPVAAEMEVFSPFIPLNAKDSALPATVFRITVENLLSSGISVEIAAKLENSVCFHGAAELDAYRTVRSTERGLLLLSAEAAPLPAEHRVRPPILIADFEGMDYGDWKVTGSAFGEKPATGTLPNQQRVSGFEGKGLVNTYLGGDGPQGTLTSPPFKIDRKHLNFLLGGGGHAGATCMSLLVDGKVVRTAAGRDNEKLEWRSWKVDDLEGKDAVLEIVDRHSGGWGHINVDQIELSDERRGGPRGPIEKLEDWGTMAFGPAGSGVLPPTPIEKYPASERRSHECSVGISEIPRGGKHTFTFVLAWHFPNAEHGNFYATRFKDAAEVAGYVLDHLHRLEGETRRWHDTYYDSTLPRWLLDRLHMPVANLATGTCRWWANGRFWAWEGVGCCHGTCTHVWNYAHAMARLFPELERSVREMQDLGEAFHESGLIGFRGERNGHHAADGQAGSVLKCYREHLMSPDDAFLRRNWPRIKKALEYCMEQDSNDDGLIEGSQHNTFDINFEGPNTFVGSLYLAALRAGEELAKEAGDLEFAARARKAFESGSRLSVERLWNGEYFIQIVDLAKHPKHQYADGCLADQVFGQGWAHHVGLGYIYPRKHVIEALRSVWKYDWAPDVGPQNAAYKPDRFFASPGEAGLFTCTWPKSKHLDEGVLYRDEVWTGIEYQVAGHMVWEGMLEEALAIVRAVHDRYDAAKRNPWNEVECGDHYARALASWGVFTALAGFEHHGPRGHIGFAPRITPEDFKAAFTAAEGWGTFTQTRSGGAQREKIEVRWGKLRLKSLAFAVPRESPPRSVVVSTAGRTLAAAVTTEEGRLGIELGAEVTLLEGDSVEVLIS